jgi:Ca2+-dependent lipid-binding protein
MNIIAQPIEAQLCHNTEFLFKMDPYCVLSVGNKKKRTSTCRRGGKSPRWGDSFTFPLTDKLMKVEVWDQASFSDDLVG